MAFGKGCHLHLIDGSAFIFRAYHALPPLTRKERAENRKERRHERVVGSDSFGQTTKIEQAWELQGQEWLYQW